MAIYSQWMLLSFVPTEFICINWHLIGFDVIAVAAKQLKCFYCPVGRCHCCQSQATALHSNTSLNACVTTFFLGGKNAQRILFHLRWYVGCKPSVLSISISFLSVSLWFLLATSVDLWFMFSSLSFTVFIIPFIHFVYICDVFENNHFSFCRHANRPIKWVLNQIYLW